MIANYDSCEYKLALPEVNLLADTCEIKLTFIGKTAEVQTQLAILSCELTSLKKEVYEVELAPDMIRIDSNVRISVTGSFTRPASGFGIAGARLKVCVADLLKKQKAEIYFLRGGDRKWLLSGIEMMENAEIDRNVLREKRRKLRRLGDQRWQI